MAIFRCALAAVAALVLAAGCSAPMATPIGAPQPSTANAASPIQPLTRDNATIRKLRYGLKHHSFINTVWLPGQVIPGRPDVFMMNDGEIVADPATEDYYVDPYSKKTCQWGITTYTPPPCDSTGPVRRIYSKPSSSYVEAQWVTPASEPSWPDTTTSSGYLYVTGYPLKNLGNNTEAGFIYSNANNWYTAYMSWPGTGSPWYDGSGVHFAPGVTLSVDLAAATGCPPGYGTNCAISSYGGTCASNATGCTVANGCDEYNHQCYRGDTAPDPNWSSSGCCVTATIVSIAQTKNNFANLDTFGPIAQLSCSSSSQSNACSPNLLTGTQCYPSNKTKVIVTSYSGLGKETDKIYLHTGSNPAPPPCPQ